MDYTVKLENIELSLCIGIADHEYNNAQNVLVTIEMDGDAVADTSAFKGINDCIDYAPIYNKIHELCLSASHIDLLEHLAHTVLDICFAEQKHVRHARVTVSKPDLYKGNAVPSVTLSRSR